MLGQIVQKRRTAMEMSLSALSGLMGGSPGAPFLSKVESGIVEPSRPLALRLARALDLPEGEVLNAAGFATDAQETMAAERLREALFQEAPVMVQVPVYDENGPTGERRKRLLRSKFDARIVDLVAPANAPFQGEVIYDARREPVEGTGVVALVGGELSAWTWHAGVRDSSFLENARGEKLASGFKIHGVIVRVTSTMDLG